HAAGSHSFRFKSMAAPDCEVTIEVLDAEKQAPLKGARVSMHPYRGSAGEDGVVKLQVVKGSYKLLVSATRYIADAKAVEINGDTKIRVELALEPVIDQSSYYI